MLSLFLVIKIKLEKLESKSETSWMGWTGWVKVEVGWRLHFTHSIPSKVWTSKP